jgi:hypothetical protein
MMTGLPSAAQITHHGLFIIADVSDFEKAVDVCNLYRTTPVGDYNLWRYGEIEARVGRALVVPAAETV